MDVIIKKIVYAGQNTQISDLAYTFFALFGGV